MQEKSALGRALATVRDLRKRCPWDRAQTRETLRPYLVEEVLELDAALREDDLEAIREEMGDFLLHLAWQFVIAEENGEFTPDDIGRELEAKMRRRHPHLYDLGPAEPWAQVKRREGPRGTFEGLPPTLPALMMAFRLQQRAAGLGFDWPDTAGPAAKVREELLEVEEHLPGPAPADPAADPNQPALPADALVNEIGDLLFAVVNLARKAHVDPTLALDRANRKFRERFGAIEGIAAERGVDVSAADLEVLDGMWEEVKGSEERKAKSD